MTKEQAVSHIEKEFAIAKHAQSIGNDGMVRVCARRAAGVVITFWMQTHPRAGWGVDTMSQLRNLQLDDSMPEEVRDAAKRLTAKITEQFTPQFSTDPIEDANIIITFLMEQT